MKRVFWGMRLCLLPLLLLLTACATTAGATQSATQAPTTATTAATTTTLPLGCPDATSPLASATRLTIQPRSGPVGTHVTVTLTGAQANCHLMLSISVLPSLSETQNTPVAAPGLSYPVQWTTTGPDGALTMPFCVCATIATWTNDQPQITSVTPQPGTAGVGDYAPSPHDYFFFTLTGPGIPSSSPVFAKFSVTG